MTDSQIVIGYGDDAGFPVSPGLSHETSDAIEAMIDWCNEQGGINGREIVGNYYDATFTDVVNAMTRGVRRGLHARRARPGRSTPAQEETRLGCGLPSVPTYSVSPEFANAPLMYQAVPNPADIYPAGWAEQIAELFPDEIEELDGDVRQLRRHHRHQGQGAADVRRLRLRVPRLPHRVQHRRRARLEALRPTDEGLRGRGRLLLGPALPQHAEPARRRRAGRLRPDLAHRLQRLPPVVRRLERHRQRRPASTSARRSRRSSRPTRTRPPSSTSTS